MWKLIFLCVALYVLYKLFAKDFLLKKRENEKVDKAETDRKIAAGEMVKDPECGTYVSVDDSISVTDDGVRYYFCSYECRDKFLKKLGESGRNIPHISDDD